MSTPFVLGRNVNHDPLSRNFPAPVVTVPKTTLHTHYGPVLDQGQVGSCTGNATVDALMTAPLRVKGRNLTEADALQIYSDGTKLDGDPAWYNLATKKVDTGCDGNSVMKAARALGLVTAWTTAFGLDHTIAALPGGPAIVGINWYEGMFTPDAKGFIRPTGTVQGGHEIALLGANVTSRYLTFLNSWGASWGKKGKFYLTFDDFARLLSEQGDVIFPTR